MSLLPGFAEYDLPHLEERDLSPVAWPLIVASVRDEDRREPIFRTLLDDVINRDVVRGVALRTPLFLTFVLRLLIDGKQLGKDRVSIYSQIVDAIGTPPPVGQPGAAAVLRAAEAIGFASLRIDRDQRGSLQRSPRPTVDGRTLHCRTNR